jgi:hypothetical protein
MSALFKVEGPTKALEPTKSENDGIKVVEERQNIAPGGNLLVNPLQVSIDGMNY